MNIPKFIFEMQTEHYGLVRSTFISLGAISKFRKKLPDYKERSGREICVAIVSSLCFTSEENLIDGEFLTDSELSLFAENFLENYPELLKEKEEPIELPRQEGESSVDYFGRVLVAYIDRWHASIGSAIDDGIGKVFRDNGIDKAFREVNKLSGILKESPNLAAFKSLNSATDSIHSVLKGVEHFQRLNSPVMSAMEAINRQNDLFDSLVPKGLREAQRYQEIIKSMSPPASISLSTKPFYEIEKLPTIPPNPIHKTNEKLEDLNERMDAFAETLVDHLKASAIALQDVASQIEKGSKGTSTQNKIAILIAALSFLVAVGSFFKDSFGPAIAPAPEQNLQPVVSAPAPQLIPHDAIKAKSTQPILAAPKQ